MFGFKKLAFVPLELGQRNASGLDEKTLEKRLTDGTLGRG
jgi:hypothetical protein